MQKTIDFERLALQKLVELDKLPTKDIGFQKFPCAVYLHPRKPFRTERQLNELREVVEVKVATEHKMLTVDDQESMERELKRGYQLKAYVPAALDAPVSDDEIYGGIQETYPQQSSRHKNG